ncbi:MAG: hypothetical protein KF789_10885 [Bdellovibrionaceae bacterium]|nr:hypothetical protein [Pseudobdellovibrionaceae bacterium]
MLLFDRKTLQQILLFTICLGLIWQSLSLLETERPREIPPYATPPDFQYFTFGMKEQAADMLWLRAVQDFDYCEKSESPHQCVRRGWLYNMLDLITDMAPSFRMPYAVGGLALSVLISDTEGATRFFEKGVHRFPHDWAIVSRAAYHALYEEKDRPKAIRLLTQAAKEGAPKWYFLLANRLAVEDGHLDLAENLISDVEAANYGDDRLLQSLRERVERARRQADSPADARH